MNPKRVWLASLLLLPIGVAAAWSQEKQAVPAGATDDPMMAKMKEFATPGAAHKVLDGKVGKWNAELKMWMAPGTEPVVSKGTSEIKWILGGRYLEDNFSGTFMGEAFQGRGVSGYDNLKKKYFSTWVDTASTGIFVAEGTLDPGTKTFAYAGECPDVMAGKYVKARNVEKMVDKDHWTMQMYTPGPDGKEFLSMEIHYTRAK